MKPIEPDIKLLQALADPTRLAIVRELGGAAEVCACDFTACCDVRQPTVSHHLKVLREAGVITSERSGARCRSGNPGRDCLSGWTGSGHRPDGDRGGAGRSRLLRLAPVRLRLRVLRLPGHAALLLPHLRPDSGARLPWRWLPLGRA